MPEHRKKAQQELRNKKREDALRENLKKRRAQKQERSDTDRIEIKQEDK